MANKRASTSRTRAAKAAGGKGVTPIVGPSEAEASQLSSLIDTRPQSKLGQVRRLWPEIKAALRDGHQLKQVWECLVHDGIELSWSKFRTYIVRLRKLEAAGADLPGGGTEPRDVAPRIRRCIQTLPNAMRWRIFASA